MPPTSLSFEVLSGKTLKILTVSPGSLEGDEETECPPGDKPASCNRKERVAINRNSGPYTFADEIIENDQDGEGKEAVDDEVGIDQIIFHIVWMQSETCRLNFPQSFKVIRRRIL